MGVSQGGQKPFFEQFSFGNARIAVIAVDDAPKGLAGLTPAEEDVARLASAGLSNEEIAEARGSSSRTVANQVAAIFRKLQIGSRAELVARWRR